MNAIARDENGQGDRAIVTMLAFPVRGAVSFPAGRRLRGRNSPSRTWASPWAPIFARGPLPRSGPCRRPERVWGRGRGSVSRCRRPWGAPLGLCQRFVWTRDQPALACIHLRVRRVLRFQFLLLAETCRFVDASKSTRDHPRRGLPGREENGTAKHAEHAKAAISYGPRTTPSDLQARLCANAFHRRSQEIRFPVRGAPSGRSRRFVWRRINPALVRIHLRVRRVLRFHLVVLWAQSCRFVDTSKSTRDHPRRGLSETKMEPQITQNTQRRRCLTGPGSPASAATAWQQ
jgi:hypothetical protein